MKKVFSLMLSVFISILMINGATAKEHTTKTEVSNRLFAFNMPKDTEGTYTVEKKNKGINIYDKHSKKAGFGGFAFGIRAYKNPSDHANLPGGKKIGELVDKHGNVYDMVLKYPTDVQFDYVNNNMETYKKLYDYGEHVTITGKNKAKYYKDRGMKGEDLYKDVLAKHLRAIDEKWESPKLEEENMSYMYNVISKTTDKTADKIGYAFYDVNGDGIEELFIGEIAEGEWKGVIYDIYTMVDRKPTHVASGGSRNRYYVSDDNFICNEYSSGANESGWLIYNLVENSKELFPQVGFKYDGYENKKNPWFISYEFYRNKWENVSKQTFDERKRVFNKYTRFEYTPLSHLRGK